MNKQIPFANNPDPIFQEAAELAILLHKRPSEILELNEPVIFKIRFDHALLTRLLNRESKTETEEEKKQKLLEFKKRVTSSNNTN